MISLENKKLHPLQIPILLVSGTLLGWICDRTIPDETVPKLADYVIPLFLSIVFFISLRYLYLSFMIPWIIRNHHTRLQGDVAICLKVGHHVYVLLMHSLFAVWICCSVPTRNWNAYFGGMWEYYPDQSQVRCDIILYILKIGYHSASLSLILYEPMRDDFVLTIVHHLATMILVACSFEMNCMRVGLMVMLYHDVTDGAVSFPKLCNYYRQVNSSIAAMIMMIVLWFTFRIYLFGRLILYSVFPYRHLCSNWFNMCILSLLTLWCMHFFWFCLMLQIAYVAAASGGKQIVDVSETAKAKKSVEGASKDEKERHELIYMNSSV